MMNISRQRLLVEKVFVSPCRNVKESFSKRDFNDQDTLLSELDQVIGNTWGKKLNYFVEFLLTNNVHNEMIH